MRRFVKIVRSLGHRLDQAAGLAIIAMMVLTSADVVSRAVYQPIPGVYDLVGILGAITVSLAMAHTFTKDGHVAVTLIVSRFPQKGQRFVAMAVNLIGTFFFGMLAWQLWVYGGELRADREVTLILQWPVFPFVYVMATGCAALSLVQVAGLLQNPGEVVES